MHCRRLTVGMIDHTCSIQNVSGCSAVFHVPPQCQTPGGKHYCSSNVHQGQIGDIELDQCRTYGISMEAHFHEESALRLSQ